ncbi:MAG: hypothetical protein IIC02_06100 [Planctomycetes bacterium]|nr:hypothetical protein [Planctomycetota bacterium]
MEAIDLDEALTRLTEFEERKWRLVEHRLFGRLTVSAHHNHRLTCGGGGRPADQRFD